MINMGLPPQVSPTTRDGREGRDRGRGGWHAMPPNVPPLSGPGPGPRIPTAIVPPGVPPHIRPRHNQGPQGPQGSQGAQGAQGWNSMPQSQPPHQQTRQEAGGGG